MFVTTPTTTGAMKNAFNGLLNINRHYTHTWIHDTLVDLLSIQKEVHDVGQWLTTSPWGKLFQDYPRKKLI
jgi:hypothetical protein